MNLTFLYLWLICAISLACADLLLGTAYLLILGIAAAFGFFWFLFYRLFHSAGLGLLFYFSVIGVLFYSLRRKSSLKADNQFRKASEY